MHKCGREPKPLGLGGYYTTVPLIQYDNCAEKYKVAEKMAMRHLPHFMHKFLKLSMYFL
jgi:hypothetical protein